MTAPRCVPQRATPRPWQVVAARCLALAATPERAAHLAAGQRQRAADGAARARRVGAAGAEGAMYNARDHGDHEEQGDYGEGEGTEARAATEVPALARGRRREAQSGARPAAQDAARGGLQPLGHGAGAQDGRRRGVRGGDLSRAQVEALRPYFDAALTAVRALALAMPPSPSALAGLEAKR